MAKSGIVTYQTENYTITIDRASCLSCGTCEALAPKTFKLDKESISIVKDAPNDPPKEILAAAESCGFEAITLIDKKTGKKIWPR